MWGTSWGSRRNLYIMHEAQPLWFAQFNSIYFWLNPIWHSGKITIFAPLWGTETGFTWSGSPVWIQCGLVWAPNATKTARIALLDWISCTVRQHSTLDPNWGHVEVKWSYLDPHHWSTSDPDPRYRVESPPVYICILNFFNFKLPEIARKALATPLVLHKGKGQERKNKQVACTQRSCIKGLWSQGAPLE